MEAGGTPCSLLYLVTGNELEFKHWSIFFIVLSLGTGIGTESLMQSEYKQ